MARLLLILTAILLYSPLFAQNLVPNPSFEEYENGCPENWHDMPIGWSWWRYNANSFSTCVTPEVYGDSLGWAPLNGLGYQWPFDGDSYVGVFCLGNSLGSLDNQEYVGAELVSPLQPGQEYDVSLMVSATFDNSMYYSMSTACSHFGVLFTTQAYHWEDNPLEIPNFAHVYSTEVITDSLGWTSIEGSFVADQAYTHMGIGLFFDGSLGIIDTVHVVTEYESAAYYFIDNISVEQAETSEIQAKPEQKGNLHVYPNPAQKEFYAEGAMLIKQLEIFDNLGNQIASEQVNNFRIAVNSELWPNGVYFIKASTENGIIYNKVILNR